ncbi:MAG: acyltransferase family protein [Acetobacteraceae bacterium]|nr:acyltransferase family protein [Acetobacteraceae bacterium]
MRNVPVDRLRRLDALRGIAAFVVVVNHAALAVPEAIRESLPSVSSPFLISGRFCVMVFFVLSPHFSNGVGASGLRIGESASATKTCR